MASGILIPNAEQTRLLEGVDWGRYVRLNDEVTSPSIRMAYYCGWLEIMTISSGHEDVNWLLGQLFTSLAFAFEIESWSLGSATHRHRMAQAGFEPDSCFYVSRFDRIPRQGVLECPRDPAPDLVIEVDISRSSLDKLPAYAAVGCRECWRYREGSVLLYSLEPDAARLVETSNILPGVTATDLATLLSLAAPGRHLQWTAMVIEWARSRRAGS